MRGDERGEGGEEMRGGREERRGAEDLAFSIPSYVLKT